MTAVPEQNRARHALYQHCDDLLAGPEGSASSLLAVERELLPTYREALGFVAFTIARTSDSTAISCSIWQTHHQAEQATRMIENVVEALRTDLDCLVRHPRR